MKKIGILFGKENSFPPALVERINDMKVQGVEAEAVSIEKVKQASPTDYAVIIDRISQDVPFYRAFLKNAAVTGTAVINNPFWWSADEKFFNNALMERIGMTMPKTVILPSKERPDDTDENSFRNLKMPLDFDGMFDYVGWPAFFKPHDGGGWKNVYKVHNTDDLMNAYDETGRLVMMLQENIDFELYFRCYCIGLEDVRVMRYEPGNEFHERYVRNADPIDPALIEKVENAVMTINEYLGYDFNTVEIAVKDGVLYPIDFCNPAPDCDEFSVGKDNFDWVLSAVSKMAIKRAQLQDPAKSNLTWGKFVTSSVNGLPLK